jgi:hypothetical protein
MSKKNNAAAKPIKGDDEGNLIKAGYAPSEIAKAKKLYAQEIKERGEVVGGLTFSDFLFEQAALAFVLSEAIGEE